MKMLLDPRAATDDRAVDTRLPVSPPAATGRLQSLDAFRGLIMFTLLCGGIFHSLADHPLWGWLARHNEHVAWQGLVYWDLIQPAFMYMVGVAMPFAFAVACTCTGTACPRRADGTFTRTVAAPPVTLFFRSLKKPICPPQRTSRLRALSREKSYALLQMKRRRYLVAQAIRGHRVRSARAAC